MGARKARRSARGSLGKLVGDLRPDGGGVHPFLFREPRADAEGLTRPAVKAEKSSHQAVVKSRLPSAEPCAHQSRGKKRRSP